MSLAALSLAAFRELEVGDNIYVKHEGPVGQRSLAALARDGGIKISWKEYRVHVLKWLEAMGIDGPGLLGSATMKGLMKEKEKSNGPGAHNPAASGS